MNAISQTHSIVIAETHVEICGHSFTYAPTIDELANILGHNHRTMKFEANVEWMWDDIGVAAISRGCRFDRPDPHQHTVSYVLFVLRTNPGDKVGPRKPLSGKITVFGESWIPNDDPHRFIGAVLNSSQHLGIHPRLDMQPDWRGINHATQELRGKGQVFILDPSTDPSVPRDSPHEVSIIYAFPRLRPEAPDPPTLALPQQTSASPSALHTAAAPGPVTIRRDALEIAKDETIREWTRWFWRGGWKFFVVCAILLAAICYYYAHK